MAERGGFEPPIRFNPYNGLANRRLQPLGHLSTQNSSPLPDQSGNCDWGVKIGAKIYPKPLELSCFKQGSSLRDWPIVDRMGTRIWEIKTAADSLNKIETKDVIWKKND